VTAANQVEVGEHGKLETHQTSVRDVREA
jgi:hypothetical protein